MCSPMHSRDRAFNGVNFARKDRMFLSGRGSFAGTSPVRATFSSLHLTLSLFYIVRSILQPSESLSPHLARLFLNGALPAYPSENFLRTILPFFLHPHPYPSTSTTQPSTHTPLPCFILSNATSVLAISSSSFSFLMSLPMWIITSAKKALSSFFPAWVLFYS